eukprot:INCI2441.1.p2 GENE.INCI2441.1~~INCI2441.1.p2  ORF type:complete len:359 (+),score=64.67 INCI2441.1:77-1153(+)
MMRCACALTAGVVAAVAVSPSIAKSTTLRAVAMSDQSTLSLVDVDLATGDVANETTWSSDFSVPRLWGVSSSAFGADKLHFVLSTQYEKTVPFRFMEVDVQSGRTTVVKTDLQMDKDLIGAATNGVVYFDSFAPAQKQGLTNLTFAKDAQVEGSLLLQHDQFDTPSPCTTFPAGDASGLLLASNAVYLNVYGPQNASTLLVTVGSDPSKPVHTVPFEYPKTAPPNYQRLGSTVFLLQSAAAQHHRTSKATDEVYALWSHDVCPAQPAACSQAAVVSTVFFGTVDPVTGDVGQVFFSSDTSGLEFLRKIGDGIGWSFHYSASNELVVVSDGAGKLMWSIDKTGTATLSNLPEIIGFLEG